MSAAPDYLERLVRFVGATPYEAIPASVLARTREILVDTLPVIATCMRAPGQAVTETFQVLEARDARKHFGAGPNLER